MKVKVGEIQEDKKFRYEGKEYQVVKPQGLDGYYYGFKKIFTTRKNVVLAVKANAIYKTDIYPFEKDVEVEAL